jgi:hypothetical protein
LYGVDAWVWHPLQRDREAIATTQKGRGGRVGNRHLTCRGRVSRTTAGRKQQMRDT